MRAYAAHDRMPDGVPAPRARRPGRRAVRALHELHRRRPLRVEVDDAAARGRARAPARVRPVRRAAQAVALGDGRRRCRRGGSPRTSGPRPAARSRSYGDGGWGRLVASGRGEDERFADELVAASAALIRERWRPEPAPTWVTCVPSMTHPDLVPDFAARLADALGLPFHEVVRKVAQNQPQAAMQNSAQQVRNVWDAFEVSGAAARARRPGPARRRPRRLEVDAHGGRARPPPGRERPRASRSCSPPRSPAEPALPRTPNPFGSKGASVLSLPATSLRSRGPSPRGAPRRSSAS